MANFTSNTYQMKRKILTFTNKISRPLSKPEKKFTADITYGILASGSCLLTDIVDQLMSLPKRSISLIVYPDILKKALLHPRLLLTFSR